MAEIAFIPFAEAKQLAACQPGDLVYSFGSDVVGSALVAETTPGRKGIIALKNDGIVVRTPPDDTLVMPYCTQECCIQMMGSISHFVNIPEQHGSLLYRDDNWQLLLQIGSAWQCYDFKSGKLGAGSKGKYICHNWRLMLPWMRPGVTADPTVIFEQPRTN